MSYLSLPPFGRSALPHGNHFRRLGTPRAPLWPPDVFALATASADEPRDAHYVETDEGYLRALLLEPEATNLISDSTATTGNWNRVTAVLEEAPSSPPGVGPAFRIIPGANGYVSFPVAEQPAGDYTFSVWLRADTETTLALSSVGGWLGSSQQAITVTPEWKRYSVVLTGSGTGGSSVLVGGYGTLAAPEVVDAAGPMFQPGALSSYVPTHGAPATREEDSLSFPIDFAPRAMSLLYRYRATAPVTDSAERGAATLNMGGSASNHKYVSLDVRGATKYQLGDGTREQTAGNFVCSEGDVVSHLMRIAANGTISGEVYVNGALVESLPGVASVIPADWTDPAIYLPPTVSTELLNIAIDADPDATLADLLVGGDLFSYRPGDDLSGATFSRPSAATYLAKNPASLPPVPAKLTHLWLLDEVYPGGRIPDRIGNVALINGVDDAVGTSDATPIRGGVSLADGDFLRPEAAVDVRTAFTTGTVEETNDYLLDLRGPSGQVPNGYLAASAAVVGNDTTNIRQDGVETTEQQKNLVASADPTFAGIELDGLYSTQFTVFSRHSASQAAAEGHFVAVSDQQMTEAEWEEVRQYAMAVLARRGIYMDPPTVEGAIQDQYVIHD